MADGFRDIEAAVHCAIGVGAQDGDGDPAELFRAADGVRLRRRGLQRGDVQRLGKRVRFGGVAGDGEAEGTGEGVEVAEAAVRRGPFRSKGASNLGGGERDLRRLASWKMGCARRAGPMTNTGSRSVEIRKVMLESTIKPSSFEYRIRVVLGPDSRYTMVESVSGG